MTKKADTSAPDLRRLEELVKKYGRIGADNLALDLFKAPERWHRLVRSLGRKQAYEAMARYLCREFRLHNGREFLFSDRCVAGELRFHVEAYLWTKGFPGARRHPATLFFSRAALDRHCRTVEIDEKDLHSLRQRVVFRYRKGVKERRVELACGAGK